MAMKLLYLPAADLENEIYEFAEKNPALEITEKKTRRDEFKTRKSAVNNELLENTEYEQKSLADNLKAQFNLMRLSDAEHELGIKLIDNLNSDGFHILSPLSFLKNGISERTLNKVLSIVQNLEPTGTCVKNVEESLLVQAKSIENPNELALFILDGHFDFLNPPILSKIQKRIKDFLNSERKLKNYGSESQNFDFLKNLSEEKIQAAMDFIKTLDPKPARNFGQNENNFISADAIIKKVDGKIEVSFPKDSLPDFRISSEFKKVSGQTAKDESQKPYIQYAKDSIQAADDFIESLNFRRVNIQKAAMEIANRQFEFFEKGPAFLKPFLQKDLAKIIGVHETTVSRIANGKYIECDWGLFPFSYFFSTAIESNSEDKSDFSKESIKFKIKKLLDEHKNDPKVPSDQKIADFLAEKGIKIARRTVAKYRNELNLGSSYER